MNPPTQKDSSAAHTPALPRGGLGFLLPHVLEGIRLAECTAPHLAPFVPYVVHIEPEGGLIPKVLSN